jgi:hypothetical protein
MAIEAFIEGWYKSPAAALLSREPVARNYENGPKCRLKPKRPRVHGTGTFQSLEDRTCLTFNTAANVSNPFLQ